MIVCIVWGKKQQQFKTSSTIFILIFLLFFHFLSIFLSSLRNCLSFESIFYIDDDGKFSLKFFNWLLSKWKKMKFRYRSLFVFFLSSSSLRKRERKKSIVENYHCWNIYYINLCGIFNDYFSQNSLQGRLWTLTSFQLSIYCHFR